MGVPLYTVGCFSLAAFNFSFSHFNYNVSWCVLLGLILNGALCASWIRMTISFPVSWKFSAVLSSDVFLTTFSFLEHLLVLASMLFWFFFCASGLFFLDHLFHWYFLMSPASRYWRAPELSFLFFSTYTDSLDGFIQLQDFICHSYW